MCCGRATLPKMALDEDAGRRRRAKTPDEGAGRPKTGEDNERDDGKDYDDRSIEAYLNSRLFRRSRVKWVWSFIDVRL